VVFTGHQHPRFEPLFVRGTCRTEVIIMKFVVKKASNGEFRFNLVASNGQVVATSESYKQKASAMNTIASIQKSVGGASIDDQTVA
jgi:uncharacterized protein YegP (UPF0339 family)